MITVLLLALAAGPASDWPQWLGPQRDGVWREEGIVGKLPPGGPKILWRTPIGGGYAGPAVAGGKVYINDRQLAPGQSDPANPFKRADSKGTERLLCLDAATGKILWKYEYPCHYTMSYPSGPRTTPVVRDGKVWSLGAMGDIVCLDAAKGTLVWKKSLMTDFKARVPVWGFAAHLLLDGDNLITLCGRDPAVVALNKDTGKEVWRALKIDAADIGYCPPVIYTFGGKRHLVIWHPESVNGLDPATGKLLWSHEWQVRANLSIPMPRQVGADGLFLTSFYNGCRLLKIGGKDGVELVWVRKGRDEKTTDGLHSIMPTPVIRDGYVYGVGSYGELRCLSLSEKGKRVWQNLTATGTGGKRERWANAFLIPHGDRYFIPNEKGELIIAKMSPRGYEEVSRTQILQPTSQLVGLGTDRKVVWSHPAFAQKCMFIRNDKEIVAVSLAADK